uniref:Uncharacterized protein n=1 Tax=Tetraselmis chuii TaxID=63592 RepID=A0A7S1SWX8_9CHLO|mmetsp:Transcript_34023/g.60761  ORF Transcript_34023/g.60761 Transcript_34023/m.60761 type:complete len:137 (+) Transcript_34023:122-532(+)
MPRETKKEYLQRKRAERSVRRRQHDEEFVGWKLKPQPNTPLEQQLGSSSRPTGRSTGPKTAAERAAEEVERVRPLKACRDTVEAPGTAWRLPKCALDEVGWGPKGAAPMPERPQWEGVASTAEALEALETEAFQKA